MCMQSDDCQVFDIFKDVGQAILHINISKSSDICPVIQWTSSVCHGQPLYVPMKNFGVMDLKILTGHPTGLTTVQPQSNMLSSLERACDFNCTFLSMSSA